MGQTLINDIYDQWKSAKKQAQEECENRSLFNMAEKYRVCSMLNGTESVEEVLKLFVTPQGIEFCTKHSFPAIEMCRRFKGPVAESLGVFVEQNVSARNLPMVYLIGKCHAELEYDENSTGHQVILMHGATAHITASKWAVVYVNTDGGGEATVEVADHAKVL